MILRYEFGGNEYECGDDFEYDADVTKKDLIQITKEHTNASDSDDTVKLLNFFLFDLDGTQELLEEYFEEELHDYFEDDAREAYEDCCEYEKDPLGYYGMKQSDFI